MTKGSVDNYCYNERVAFFVDQSGKVEYTSHHTVVAFSNGTKKAVIIKARDKRLLQKKFREAGKNQTFAYRLFALLIFFLFKDIKITELVIDTEYPGRNDLIKSFLLADFRKAGIKIDSSCVRFGHIGKNCEAHWHSYYVFKGKRKADRVITVSDVLKHLFG